MASTELDPIFLKGLRLLHSRSKDSAEQLKQLLDEALAQSKLAATAKDRNSGSIKIENVNKLYLKKSNSREPTDLTVASGKQMPDDSRKRDCEKRSIEKVKPDDLEIIHEAKLPKLDSPQVVSYYSPSPDPPKLDHFLPKEADDDSDSSDENANADDFAMEMGLACVICKQLDVSHGNQLIECQECHSLFHQECHSPPATDYDVNDPRRVWYCAKCTKNMKKMASKTQKPAKIISSSVAKETTSQARFTKPETSQPASVLPFKRSELKAPLSQGNNQSSTNKPIGLAGLAANFSGRVASTASTSTSLSSTSRPTNTKATTQSSLKTFSNIPSYGNLSTLKTVTSTPSSSTSSLKIVTTSSASSSSSSSVPPLVIAKCNTSTPAPKTGLALLSAVAPASSSRGAAAASSNNGGTKQATCSLLMSADKRVQIMKKRAAKLQEKRRLSTK